MAMTKSEAMNALRICASYEFDDIPKTDADIDFEFSPEFYKKMQKILKNISYNESHIISLKAKRMLVLAAILILLFAGIMSVEAVREPIVNIFLEIYEEFMDIVFEGDLTEGIEYIYSFSEIPNGFFETERISNLGANIVKYENTETNSVIILNQNITDGASFSLDTQHGHIESFVVNDIEVKVYLSDYGTDFIAFWVVDRYFMSLTYSGETDINNILTLIESIK